MKVLFALAVLPLVAVSPASAAVPLSDVQLDVVDGGDMTTLQVAGPAVLGANGLPMNLVPSRLSDAFGSTTPCNVTGTCANPFGHLTAGGGTLASVAIGSGDRPAFAIGVTLPSSP